MKRVLLASLLAFIWAGSSSADRVRANIRVIAGNLNAPWAGVYVELKGTTTRRVNSGASGYTNANGEFVSTFEEPANGDVKKCSPFDDNDCRWVYEYEPSYEVKIVAAGFGTIEQRIEVNWDRNPPEVNGNFTLVLNQPPAYAEAVVRGFYQDILGREADAGGLAVHMNSLRSKPPVAVASTFLISEEYRRKLVQSYYSHFLERNADENGLVGWVNFIARGARDELVIQGLICSQEFYNLGGQTDQGFVARLYETVLGRTPSEDDLNYWVAQLPQKGCPGVVQGFIGSLEYRNALVGSWYQGYLDRAADPIGRSNWTAAMNQGAKNEDIQAAILGSAEYVGLKFH